MTGAATLLPPPCIFCNSNPGTTNDHVPPQAFFPLPHPSDFITVPACFDCNNGAGKDEDFFFASFMFGDAGISPAGKSLWAEKINRMYEKNPGLKRKIAEHLAEVKIKDPITGAKEHRLGLKIDEPRFDRVINKIVRGLYYFEFGNALPPTAQIITLFLNTDASRASVKGLASALKPGKRGWSDVFTYKCNRLPESRTESAWNMTFYSCVEFFSITGDSVSAQKGDG